MNFIPLVIAAVAILVSSALSEGLQVREAYRMGASSSIVGGISISMIGKLIALFALGPYLKPVIGWLFGANAQQAGSPASQIASTVADVAGGFANMAGGVMQRVTDQFGRIIEQRGVRLDQGEMCTRLMQALGGPDYVEVFSYDENGNATKRVFGSPPAAMVAAAQSAPQPAQIIMQPGATQFVPQAVVTVPSAAAVPGMPAPTMIVPAMPAPVVQSKVA